MRRALLLIPLVVACSRSPQTQGAAAAGPMALTEADIAGTWTGTSMPEGTDSVVARWTQVCANGACTGTIEGTNDTLLSTYTLSGDSSMGRSTPYVSTAAGGAKAIDSWTVHLRDGKAVGTGMMVLADKPDSVLMRYHFEGSRTQ